MGTCTPALTRCNWIYYLECAPLCCPAALEGSLCCTCKQTVHLPCSLVLPVEHCLSSFAIAQRSGAHRRALLTSGPVSFILKHVIPCSLVCPSAIAAKPSRSWSVACKVAQQRPLLHLRKWRKRWAAASLAPLLLLHDIWISGHAELFTCCVFVEQGRQGHLLDLLPITEP